MIGLLKTWRFWGALGAVVAVLVLGWYIHSLIYQKGFDACQNAHNAALNEAAQAARKEIVKIGDEYEKERQKIIEKGDSGHGVGGRVSDVLDLLHSRAAN